MKLIHFVIKCFINTSKYATSKNLLCDMAKLYAGNKQ